MTITTTPLDAAREDLRQRLGSADAAEAYLVRLWLSPLHDVADMVCRVGDHDHSLHYQCDKAGDMVHASLRVRRGVHLLYAAELAGADTDDDTPADRLVDNLTDAADKVEQAIENALWRHSRLAGAGHPGQVCTSDVYALRDAGADLLRLADRLAESARPDEDDDQ